MHVRNLSCIHLHVLANRLYNVQLLLYKVTRLVTKVISYLPTNIHIPATESMNCITGADIQSKTSITISLVLKFIIIAGKMAIPDVE